MLRHGSSSQQLNANDSNTKNPTVTTTELGAEKVAEPTSVPQSSTISARNSSGTTGLNNPPDSMTGLKGGKLDSEKRAALAAILNTSCSASFTLVPRIVGMKPRDVIAVPSLRGPGEFIEDWELTDVSYKQTNSGDVEVAIRGRRPFTGLEPMLDADTVAAVKKLAEPLTTPEEWSSFWWGKPVQSQSAFALRS